MKDINKTRIRWAAFGAGIGYFAGWLLQFLGVSLVVGTAYLLVYLFAAMLLMILYRGTIGYHRGR